MLILWSEDDAGTHDRERIGEAFKRFTGYDYRSHVFGSPIESVDEGDMFTHLFQCGWVVRVVPEGHSLGVVVRMEDES